MHRSQTYRNTTKQIFPSSVDSNRVFLHVCTQSMIIMSDVLHIPGFLGCGRGYGNGISSFWGSCSVLCMLLKPPHNDYSSQGTHFSHTRLIFTYIINMKLKLGVCLDIWHTKTPINIFSALLESSKAPNCSRWYIFRVFWDVVVVARAGFSDLL